MNHHTENLLPIPTIYCAIRCAHFEGTLERLHSDFKKLLDLAIQYPHSESLT